MRWAIAISALVVASPATAVAAQTRPSHPHVATARAGEGSSRDTRLDGAVVSIGSGVGAAHGSPLVRKLQRRLAQVGYSADGIDGIFGPHTLQAVIAFQAAHQLQQDGVVGPRTWAALAAPSLSLGQGAGDEPGGSNDVRSLQRHLVAAGDRPGPIDGRYGPLTAAAVGRFQSAHGLRTDGIAGQRTLALLRAPSPSARRSAPRPARRSAPRPARRSAPRPARATPVAPTSRSNPAPAPANRSATKAHRPAAPSSHRVPSVPWIILFGLALVLAAILAFIVGAVWYVPRRGDGQFSPASDDAVRDSRAPVAAAVATNRHGAAANGHGAPANGHGAPANGRGAPANGHALAAANGNATHANGNGANGNGSNGSGATRRAHPADLRQTAEADGAFNLGVLLETQGSLVEAQAAYSRADQNGHAVAAANLGRLLEEQGALGEAEAAYRRADQRGDADAAFILGLLLEDRRAMDEASDAYRRAAERGHDGAASNLGVLLEERGDVVAAEAAYRQADERGDATGAFNLGVLLEERGSLRAAHAAYGRAEQRGERDVANLARAALAELSEGGKEARAPNG